MQSACVSHMLLFHYNYKLFNDIRIPLHGKESGFYTGNSLLFYVMFI